MIESDPDNAYPISPQISKKRRRRRRRKKEGACNTDRSRVVSDHSTTPAQRSLTSESGRDPVHSPWYDRRRMYIALLCFICGSHHPVVALSGMVGGIGIAGVVVQVWRCIVLHDCGQARISENK